MARSALAFTRKLTVVGACALLTLTACSSTAETSETPSATASAELGWPRTIEIPAGSDAEATSLTIESQPQRIATLDYESTETVAELGAAEQIVLMPEAVLNPALGGHIDELGDVEQTFPVASEVEAEAIIAQAPDLVIMSPRHGTEAPIADVLEQAGIPTLELPESWSSSESMFTNITLIGEATGHENESVALVASLSDDLEAASASSADTASAARVLVLTNQAGRPFITAGDALPIELLERAGAVSVAPDLGITRTGAITAEQIVEANPDGVVLIDMNGTGDRMFTELLSNQAVSTLAGFSAENVLRLDGRNVQALGLTATVTGLESLSEWVVTLPASTK